MTMFRMPIFAWNTLVTSLLILLAFPILTAALFGLLADRNLGALVYSRENGGALLWQHLFWFFGHPEVYIIALPFFGIVTEIIPVFSRKPLFGYKGMIGATLAIGFLSLAVWAHHMFATGAVLLPFFSFLTYLIAVPTGLKFFNWIGTMWRGQLTFETPMLWSIGFLVTFLLGGLTGVLLASPPLDWHVSDTLLRGGALPLRGLRHRGVRRQRRPRLLVPEDLRPDDGREARQAAVLDDVHRLPRHVPDPALAGQRGHAAPVRRLPAQRRLHDAEHDLDDLLLRARRLDPAVPLQRHEVVEVRPAGAARRPLGPRQLPGVGHLVAAAAAQLPRDPADPVRAARLRGALPAPDGPAAGRGARRQAPQPYANNVLGGDSGARQGPNDPDPT